MSRTPGVANLLTTSNLIEFEQAKCRFLVCLGRRLKTCLTIAVAVKASLYFARPQKVTRGVFFHESEMSRMLHV